jgi:excisionase family DNA binding protein
MDRPLGHAWTPAQLAIHIGMSSGFVLAEIRAKELAASQFGREWRIHEREVHRYCAAKGWPLPTSDDAPIASSTQSAPDA